MTDTANPSDVSPKPEVEPELESGSSVDDQDLLVVEEITRSDSGPARLISMVVGVILVALTVLLAFSGGDDPDDLTSLLGQRVPAVAGTTLGGDQYNIDDYRGSWVLVNFFATWCPGCVNEHPDLVELEQWGRDNGSLNLVSVVFNDPVERVDEFFAERGGTWPVLNSPSVPVQFQVAQIPETFLVSPAGQVVLHLEGEVRADELIEFIEQTEQQ